VIGPGSKASTLAVLLLIAARFVAMTGRVVGTRGNGVAIHA
jgi:hypothetical protein